jgi:hypothetical protein
VSTFEQAEPAKRQDSTRQSRPATAPVPAREPASDAQADGLSPASLLALQRSIGNRAVNRRLASSRLGAPAREDARVFDPADRASAPAVQRVYKGKGKAGESSRQPPPPPEKPQDYLTDAYWARRAENKTRGKTIGKGSGRKLEEILARIGPELLKQLDRKKSAAGKLELYRTMEPAEADAVLAWASSGKKAETEKWILKEKESPAGIASRYKTAARGDKAVIGTIPVDKHFGDRPQAKEYLDKSPGKRMLKFTFRPGAHQLLFDPEYLAVSGETGAAAHLRYLAEAKNRDHPEASAHEGENAGYIGMKKEEKGDFSLSVGKSDITALLFQLFLESVEDVTNS